MLGGGVLPSTCGSIDHPKLFSQGRLGFWDVSFSIFLVLVVKKNWYFLNKPVLRRCVFQAKKNGLIFIKNLPKNRLVLVIYVYITGGWFSKTLFLVGKKCQVSQKSIVNVLSTPWSSLAFEKTITRQPRRFLGTCLRDPLKRIVTTNCHNSSMKHCRKHPCPFKLFVFLLFLWSQVLSTLKPVLLLMDKKSPGAMGEFFFPPMRREPHVEPKALPTAGRQKRSAFFFLRMVTLPWN